MDIITAFQKIFKRRNSGSYYNSDFALTLKEKLAFITCIFLVVFSIFITLVILLVN